MIDPIVEEIRAYRNKHAKKFNYNLGAICDDFKQHQQKYADKLVRFKVKKLLTNMQGGHTKKIKLPKA